MSYEYIICKSNVEQYTKLLIECNPIGYAKTRKIGKEVWENVSWLCLCHRPLDLFFPPIFLYF